jgi:hypothetical protein
MALCTDEHVGGFAESRPGLRAIASENKGSTQSLLGLFRHGGRRQETADPLIALHNLSAKLAKLDPT